MTNDRQFSISRRKVLAGLGTIGVASAGAGLGTTAYFSDQETFQNNQLTAGTLDMLVDWEEHYYNGTIGAEFARLASPEDPGAYVLPGPVNNPDSRSIAIEFIGDDDPQAAKDLFWDATAIEALPDENDDGQQDEFDDAVVCTEDILVNVGGAEDGLSSDRRTESSVGEPLISLDDVKPGDFGEVTFSYHLCDNPGYVWMNGELVSAAENGHTEPEASDPQTGGPSDEVSGPMDLTTSQVELLDELRVRMWYDPDCNNQITESSEDLDIMIVVDASGSINGNSGTEGTEAYNLVQGVNAFIGALPTNGSVQVGSLLFGENNDITRFQGLSSPSGFGVSYPNSGRGNTPLPPALDIAEQELFNGSNARPGAQKAIAVFTDGGPNYESGVEYSGGGYTAPRGATGYSNDPGATGYEGGTADSSVDVNELDETANVADEVRNSGTPVRVAVVNVGDNPTEALTGPAITQYTDLPTYLEDEIASTNFYFDIDLGNLTAAADSLVASVVVGEEVFFTSGTLREALVALSGNEGRGIPLDGDRGTGFDELHGDENDPQRDCFTGGGTTHCVGLQWWLPVDHANQIQGDSVAFDVGFYTEQCRHNDGTGMVPEEQVEA
ncbi:VWA domain-containing protein [Haloplanus rubicundus]|uniref:VWA domain-containing protein n=1 Tax=Haloplanus rubicundus TaxID=1547898 RepID=A0A345E3Y4_9EURY|nr:vWA domain-containing protein [Haloplanus rubicundus]AXG06906.1 VWA domain-containing protein [Haloplanus rubicundus]